jgi:hypothetical protein
LTRRVRRSEADAIETRLVERIEAARQATVFPPSPGVLCDWCGYNDLCDSATGRYSRAARLSA